VTARRCNLVCDSQDEVEDRDGMAPLRNRDRDRIAANAGRDRARWGWTADDANCSLPGIKPS